MPNFKITFCVLIMAQQTLVAMAMWKYVKQESQVNGTSSNLSVKDIEAAQNSISKALNVAASSKSQKRGLK